MEAKKTTEAAQPRKNEGKLRWSLVDFEALRHLSPHYAGGWQGANWQALECMLKVLEFGAQKYSPNGWKAGYSISNCANSLYRHVIQLLRGERSDSETGISHYGHILCNLKFISYYLDHFPEHDDRPRTQVPGPPIKHTMPEYESEALNLLLATLAQFMDGHDFDYDELHLLGHAMHYACIGYALQNGGESARPGEVCVIVEDINRKPWVVGEPKLVEHLKELMGDSSKLYEHVVVMPIDAKPEPLYFTGHADSIEEVTVAEEHVYPEVPLAVRAQWDEEAADKLATEKRVPICNCVYRSAIQLNPNCDGSCSRAADDNQDF
jgi:hypothetical protein